MGAEYQEVSLFDSTTEVSQTPNSVYIAQSTHEVWKNIHSIRKNTFANGFKTSYTLAQCAKFASGARVKCTP